MRKQQIQSLLYTTHNYNLLLLSLFIVTQNDVYAAFVYCSVQNDPANMVLQIFF